MNNNDALIDQFVATFGKFDELNTLPELDPIAMEFATGELDEMEFYLWKPKKILTDPKYLQKFYTEYSSAIPVRLLPLYEKFVLSYRWAEIDIGLCRLFPNPMGEGLYRLGEEISKLESLREILLPNGCIQFGKGADLDYDPRLEGVRLTTSSRFPFQKTHPSPLSSQSIDSFNSSEEQNGAVLPPPP